jgi:hypothetical protein
LTAVAGSILTIAVANKRKLALGLKNSVQMQENKKLKTGWVNPVLSREQKQQISLS